VVSPMNGQRNTESKSSGPHTCLAAPLPRTVLSPILLPLMNSPPPSTAMLLQTIPSRILSTRTSTPPISLLQIRLADAPPSASANFILPPGQIIPSSNEFVNALETLPLSVSKRDTSTTDTSLVDTSLRNAVLGDIALTENTPSLRESAEPLSDASHGPGICHCESGGAHSSFYLRDTSTTDISIINSSTRQLRH
jgi:hypothetical protein